MAIYMVGNNYQDGTRGFPQNYTKALELFHRSGELGYASAYINVGHAYDRGRGVEVDKKKAKYHYELAAMKGNAVARFDLGNKELQAGNSNIDRAVKHYMIAVRSGQSESLENVKRLYSAGYATKEDYTKALQAYQEYLGEIKSAQRDKAATADEEYRYY